MLTTLAAAAALLVLAIAAHYLFWTWRLRVPGGDDEVLRARTADGWSLELGRRRPQGPPRELPVLLVHGLSVNRFFMDFGAGPNSLAAALASDGFDTFALDLRGHGGSRPGPGSAPDWCFDDYLEKDLPAALDAIREASGSARVLLLGHSQGALLALAAAGLAPDRVAGVVAMAGPTHVSVKRELRSFARAAFALRSCTRFLARMVAPFAGIVHTELSQAAMDTRNTARPVLRRMLATCVENVPTGVARQFRDWIRNDVFRSADGRVDYRARLARRGPPAFFVAGPSDGLAPPEVVRKGFEAWGGEKDWFLAARSSGLSVDYGHGDLIFGRRAPEEIYPRLRAWLAARAGPAARAG